MTGQDSALNTRAAAATGAAQPSLTELVGGILNDAQKLARQQVDMLKAEIREDMNRTKQALVYGGIGLVLLTIGGIALVFALVNVLHEKAGLSMWVSWSIFAAISLAGGAVLGYIARNLFESFNPLPDKTFNAIQENLTWKTQPQA